MNIKIFPLKQCPINELAMQARAMQFVYCRLSKTVRIIYFQEKLAPNGTVVTVTDDPGNNTSYGHNITDEPEQKDQAGNVIKAASQEFSELSELIEKEIMPLLEQKLEQFLKQAGKKLEE